MIEKKEKVSFKEMVAFWSTVGDQFQIGYLDAISSTASVEDISNLISFFVGIAEKNNHSKYSPAIQKKAFESLLDLGVAFRIDDSKNKLNKEAISILLNFLTKSEIDFVNLESQEKEKIKSFLEQCSCFDCDDFGYGLNKMLVTLIIKAEFWEMFLGNKYSFASNFCAKEDVWKEIFESLKLTHFQSELPSRIYRIVHKKNDYNLYDAMLLAGFLLSKENNHKKHSAVIALMYQMALSITD